MAAAGRGVPSQPAKPGTKKQQGSASPLPRRPAPPAPPPRFASRRRLQPPRRPLDATLAWGDCVLLLCTQLVSEIPDPLSLSLAALARPWSRRRPLQQRRTGARPTLFSLTHSLTHTRPSSSPPPTPLSQSSETIPLSEAGALGSIMVVAFVAVAAAKGDYGSGGGAGGAGPPSLDPWSRIGAMARALAGAGTTWGLGVAATLVGDALLLRCHAVSPAAFLSTVAPAGVAVGATGVGTGAVGAPPIAEVLIAALATLLSWRGIYAGLRGILL